MYEKLDSTTLQACAIMSTEMNEESMVNITVLLEQQKCGKCIYILIVNTRIKCKKYLLEIFSPIKAIQNQNINVNIRIVPSLIFKILIYSQL